MINGQALRFFIVIASQEDEKVMPCRSVSAYRRSGQQGVIEIIVKSINKVMK